MALLGRYVLDYVVGKMGSNRNLKAPNFRATPCRLASKPVVADAFGEGSGSSRCRTSPALPRARPV
jgi:hypothetical protein